MPAPATTTPLYTLPKFTFLCGPDRTIGRRVEIANTFLETDDDAYIEQLTKPLFNGICGIIYDTDASIEIKGESEIELPGLRETPFKTTVLDWSKVLEEFLRTEIHEGALGALALQNYYRDGLDTVYDHIIYPDCTQIFDTLPFISRFGHDAVLCIHVERIAQHLGNIPCRHIWLAIPELDAQLEQLKRELPHG